MEVEKIPHNAAEAFSLLEDALMTIEVGLRLAREAIAAFQVYSGFPEQTSSPDQAPPAEQ